MQSVLIYELDRIVKANINTEHTQAADLALKNMFNTGNAAASANLKDALYHYIEMVYTGINFNGDDGIFFS